MQDMSPRDADSDTDSDPDSEGDNVSYTALHNHRCHHHLHGSRHDSGLDRVRIITDPDNTLHCAGFVHEKPDKDFMDNTRT